ncbi:MAG: NADH-dependent [FeFe] hydrogenase, group A6 [Chloroflexota bacterium]|jgi:iron-only hydrogenase group A
MSTVTVNIDGRQVRADAGSTILEAANQAGIRIPTLCYHPDLTVRAVCRVCLVEVKGARTLQAACSFPVADGLEVKTNTPRIREARKVNLELLLSNHPFECPTCARNQDCELRALADEYNIRSVRFQGEKKEYLVDSSSYSLIRDANKCILCRRCVDVCNSLQAVGAIGPVNRGFDTVIAPAYDAELAAVNCAMCGQCINRCPVGALYEKDAIEDVWKAIADPDKHVVVQTAPAVRVALGEEFGMEHGAIVTGKMAAALRRLGFDAVFDTNFSADLTIMEEGYELIHRIKHGGVLPQLTSCSPGWIKYIEHFYPDLLPHLSTCKSPQQMLGAVAKTYYAQKSDIDPAKIVSVSVMPCTAKKFEAERPEMHDSGFKDVDYVLTTRELARMIKEAGIVFTDLPEEKFDSPLGAGTGAAVIFGATGGVMEAALRTAYEVVTGKELKQLDFESVRGFEGIKQASVDLDGTVVKVAVAHSLANAKVLMDRIRAGTADYHFIEIMCCPGGCLGGGGQPVPTNRDIRTKRMQAIYQEDKNLPWRKSHENPDVQQIYKEFLGEPLSERSHHLLHTHYTPRGKVKEGVHIPITVAHHGENAES